jgi:phosphoribosylanthranilate isomerase
VEIKICGLRRPEDARLAVRLGARWIGVVRAPDSPRSATLEEARRVIEAAREVHPEVRPVLATGRRTRDEVASDAFALGIERVQPHGLSDAGVRTLAEAGLIVHRVVTVSETAARLPDFDPPARDGGPLVFDVGGGGSGRAFDWRILGARAPRRAFIAGGLRPENIERLLPYEPWGVDVSSGIESSPGVKDPERLRRFFDRLRPLAVS